MRVLFVSPTLEAGGSERLTIAWAAALQARGHATRIAYSAVDTQLARAAEAGVETRRLGDERPGPRTLLPWSRALRHGGARVLARRHPRAVDRGRRGGRAGGAARAAARDRARHRRVRRAARLGRAAPLARTRHRGLGGGRRRAAPHGLRDAGRPAPARRRPRGAGAHVRSSRSTCPRARRASAASPAPAARRASTSSSRPSARLRADLPDARLVLVGDGDEAPAHHALAERLGVAGEIAFVGDVPEAAPYLAGSDVVVLPLAPRGPADGRAGGARAGPPRRRHRGRGHADGRARRRDRLARAARAAGRAGRRAGGGRREPGGGGPPRGRGARARRGQPRAAAGRRPARGDPRRGRPPRPAPRAAVARVLPRRPRLPPRPRLPRQPRRRAPLARRAHLRLPPHHRGGRRAGRQAGRVPLADGAARGERRASRSCWRTRSACSSAARRPATATPA